MSETPLPPEPAEHEADEPTDTTDLGESEVAPVEDENAPAAITAEGPEPVAGQTTPAGWYPAPGDPARQRYWDGNEWTDHYSPAHAVAATSNLPGTMSNETFYALMMGQEMGPFSGPQLQSMVVTGQLKHTTQVRRETGTWFSIVEVPGIYSDKSWLTAVLLAALPGPASCANRFYLGDHGTAVAKLLTFGGCYVWWIVDFIMTITNKVTDVHGRPLRR